MGSAFSQVFDYMGLILINYYGWVFFVALLIWLVYQMTKLSNIEKYATSIKWIVLEVKIDELNERSPFAMEQIFTSLHAIHANATWGEQLAGKIILSMSCEIVSLGGRVSYMFRLPDRYRSLLESAVFAQYPKAEIYEVEDYLKNIPKHYDPDHADFDFWGTQMNKIKQGKQSVFPIRTFPGFEHTEQETIIDPLAGVLETMSNIEPHELMASQIVIKPVTDDWKAEALPIIQKLKGVPAKPHAKGWLEMILFDPLNLAMDGLLAIFGIQTGEHKKEEKKDQPPSLIQHMSEGEKQVLAAVEHAMSKVTYEVHFRLLYLAPKGRLNKALRIPEIIGAYRHFGDYAINGLKPDVGHTWTDTAFKVSQSLEGPILRKRVLTRKRHFLHNFINRDSWKGSGHYYFNSEELATLFHFPQAPNARVSQVERVQTVKSAPPSNLPVG
jgi:hypothetical protein